MDYSIKTRRKGSGERENGVVDCFIIGFNLEKKRIGCNTVGLGLSGGIYIVCYFFPDCTAHRCSPGLRLGEVLALPCRLGHGAALWWVAGWRRQRLRWLLVLHAILEAPGFSDTDLQLLID